MTPWTAELSLEFHINGSDDSALGGDLAYWYGGNDALAGTDIQSMQQSIGAAGFAPEAHVLRPFSSLQDGFPLVS
jgi:hypothetical protein